MLKKVSIKLGKLIGSVLSSEKPPEKEENDLGWWIRRSYSEEYQKAYDTILKSLPITPKSVVGEFCCGPGEMLIKIHKKGARKIIGFDKNIEMLRYAEDNIKKHGVNARVHEKLPERREEYNGLLDDSGTIDLFVDDACFPKFSKEGGYFNYILNTFPQVSLDEMQTAAIMMTIKSQKPEGIQEGLKEIYDRLIDVRMDYSACTLLKKGGSYTYVFYDFGKNDVIQKDKQSKLLYAPANIFFDPSTLRFVAEERFEEDIRRFDQNLDMGEFSKKYSEHMSCGYMIRTWRKKKDKNI